MCENDKYKNEFTRDEVLWILNFLLQNPRYLEDAIHIENSNFNEEELLTLAEDHLPSPKNLQPIQELVKEAADFIKNKDTKSEA